jgi:hypothetical protein
MEPDEHANRFKNEQEQGMTSFWPGPAWLDCQGQDAGDGKVRCTIQVLGGGTRDVVVPDEYFDAQGRRLKVNVVRMSRATSGGGSMLDCPSMESGATGYVVDCPTIDGETNGRIDVLAAFVEPIATF